jgi:hypothetical protein
MNFYFRGQFKYLKQQVHKFNPEWASITLACKNEIHAFTETGESIISLIKLYFQKSE